MIYDITPVPKPRQTQADKWKKRPAVMRYRAFADEIRAKRVVLPYAGAEVKFFLPMPKSWSAKKKREMQYQPHDKRPDIDNLFKALADAIYDDDSRIWFVTISKQWDYKGSIEVRI